MLFKKAELIDPQEALAGRDEQMPLSGNHAVLDGKIVPPYPENTEQIVFGMGCFWGAERKFWELDNQFKDAIFTTAVGYAAGFTPNPTYQEVCSGMTGHNEVVLVVYNPDKISFRELLKVFWESHDPTQGMRQGNDRGTQYRSGIYCSTQQQLEQAQNSKVNYQVILQKSGYAEISTEISMASEFYFAEEYHQQYLHKNPQGYCGLGGTGLTL